MRSDIACRRPRPRLTVAVEDQLSGRTAGADDVASRGRCSPVRVALEDQRSGRTAGADDVASRGRCSPVRVAAVDQLGADDNADDELDSLTYWGLYRRSLQLCAENFEEWLQLDEAEESPADRARLLANLDTARRELQRIEHFA